MVFFLTDFFENIVIWLKEETIEMHNLLSAVIAFCCRAVMADHHHFTKAVTVLAYIYASRGDLSKLEACRAMFVVLTSTSVDDTSTLSSSLNANEETPFSWFEDIVIASQEMLQHKLGRLQKMLFIILDLSHFRTYCLHIPEEMFHQKQEKN